MKFVNCCIHLYSKVFKKLRGHSIVNSDVHLTAKIESGTSLINSSIGKYSFSGYDCTFINCSIGSFCSIASRVTIGGARHPIHFASTSPCFLEYEDSIAKKFSRHEYDWSAGQTTIGNDVWIGENVLIKSGITIGDGAVVGMGSVVTKDIPPYHIVAGNPARLIRLRFDQKIIDGLIKLQWWAMPDDELEQIALDFTNPEKLLRKFNLL